MCVVCVTRASPEARSLTLALVPCVRRTQGCSPLQTVVIVASNVLAMTTLLAFQSLRDPGGGAVAVSARQAFLSVPEPAVLHPEAPVSRADPPLWNAGLPLMQSKPSPPSADGPGSTRPPPHHHMVLGMASNLSLHCAQVFVQSARAAMPTASVVLFTDALTPQTAELYAAFGVDVRVYDKAKDLPPHAQGYHPSSIRWMLMHDFLSSLSASSSPLPAALMFADVRDTVFQRDPFVDLWAHVGREGLTDAFFAFQEAAPRTLSQCGWNRGWIKDCFGAGVLVTVGRRVISCSGTSMATWGAAVRYVAKMAAEIASNTCERNGVDQGVCQWCSPLPHTDAHTHTPRVDCGLCVDLGNWVHRHVWTPVACPRSCE